MIKTKRVYEPESPNDGARFLVERLWPRGFKKEALRLDGWLKDVAPSDQLRRSLHADRSRWDEFQRHYVQELTNNPDSWRPILEAAQRGNVTLLYSTRDTEHNNAVVLKDYLEKQQDSS